MTNLARVKVELSGWNGGPGVSQLTFSEGTATPWNENVIEGLVDEVNSTMLLLKTLWAPEVVVTTNPEVVIFDAATGDIQNVIVSPTPPAPFQSTASSGAASRATQITVGFKTGTWRNGRQIQGRMFLGPITGATIASDGTIALASRQAIENAFQAQVTGTGPRLCVWSRPSAAPGSDGAWADVTLVKPSARPGILSSRRD